MWAKHSSEFLTHHLPFDHLLRPAPDTPATGPHRGSSSPQVVALALEGAGRSLSPFELSRQTGRSTGEIVPSLFQLERQGKVRREGSRWSWAGSVADTRPHVEPASSTSQVSVPKGWDAVRALCSYYADCLELEAGGRASLKARDEDTRAAELDCAPDWAGLYAGHWVELGSQDALYRLIRSRHRNRIRLTGPLELLKDRKNPNGIVLPVVIQPVKARRRARVVEVQAEGPPRINEAWLETKFGNQDDERRGEVLIRLGVYSEELDERGEPYLAPRAGLRLDELWMALLRVFESDVAEKGDARRIAPKRAWTKLGSPGLYNRLLALPATSSGFLNGTMAELREIAKRSDQDLSQTALADFFAPLVEEARRARTIALPAAVPEFQPLNAEQRAAVSQALQQPLVAVQGPPGTGKSVTVTHVLAGQAMAGRPTLFASRNHRALEAVVPRLQAIDQDHPLIFRLTRSTDEESQGEDWVQAALRLASNHATEEAQQEREQSEAKLAADLSRRADVEERLCQQAEVGARQAFARDQLSRLESDLDPAWIDAARSADARWEARAQRVVSRAGSSSSLLGSWLASLKVRRRLRELAQRVDPTPELPAERSEQDKVLRSLAAWVSTSSDLQEDEQQTLPAQERETLVDQLQQADTWVRESSQVAIEALARALGAELTEDLRQGLSNLRGLIGRRDVSKTLHRQKPHVQSALNRLFHAALDFVPLWACSSLSLRSRLPLIPGAFDLAVIDEASQCDIPSSIPVLFRARRALIVGDPEQLQHVAKVGRDAEDRILESYGIDEEAFGAFLHSTNSVWNPAAAICGGRPNGSHLLREHWRCHPAIAGYVSELFYGGELRVRTPIEQTVSVPRGNKKLRGIEWTQIEGGSEATPGGSRLWQPQIVAIADEVERLAEIGFEGTLGVVTPFRAQADRIRDAVASRVAAAQLKTWDFESQTADGFQGGERDLILFSLVGGPDPADIPSFYVRERNRFNVAVSRARSLLHIFGDRSWAAQCGLDTLTGLVDAWQGWQAKASQPTRTDLIGPVWEPRLAEALRAAGMDFHQQYPACGFYLDFAILEGDLKLAIEVDGETYHRDARCNLRIDDIRRDQILRAANWRVQRFWVYQLRENLESCVEQIRSILAEAR